MSDLTASRQSVAAVEASPRSASLCRGDELLVFREQPIRNPTRSLREAADIEAGLCRFRRGSVQGFGGITMLAAKRRQECGNEAIAGATGVHHWDRGGRRVQEDPAIAEERASAAAGHDHLPGTSGSERPHERL